MLTESPPRSDAARAPLELLLRAAADDDADALEAIYVQARGSQREFAPVTALEMAIFRRSVRERGGRVLVMTHAADDAPVGFASTSQHDAATWIDELYVLPLLAGRGLGTRLLEHVLPTLPRPVRLCTFEANAGARRFYERHGFRLLGAANTALPCVLYERAV
jgi:GNAT superfamily N-acetyltransferase